MFDIDMIFENIIFITKGLQNNIQVNKKKRSIIKFNFTMSNYSVLPVVESI